MYVLSETHDAVVWRRTHQCFPMIGLQTRDGTYKLGDFNRAEMPLFNPDKGEYCKYNNGPGYGNYRSPEEFSEKTMDLDEKIDVFSFGNNIYGLVSPTCQDESCMHLHSDWLTICLHLLRYS